VTTLYRIYDNKKARWLEDNIYLAPNGDLFMMKKVMGLVKLLVVLDQDRYVCHQMINLQDVANTDIYEGDYILAKVEEDKEIVGLVVFADELGGYVLLDSKENKYYALGSDIKEFIKVIGNVFEGYESYYGEQALQDQES
jgi:hypothetical protein